MAWRLSLAMTAFAGLFVRLRKPWLQEHLNAEAKLPFRRLGLGFGRLAFNIPGRLRILIVEEEQSGYSESNTQCFGCGEGSSCGTMPVQMGLRRVRLRVVPNRKKPDTAPASGGSPSSFYRTRLTGSYCRSGVEPLLLFIPFWFSRMQLSETMYILPT